MQVVFLFGLYTWVVTPCMGRALGRFQEQVMIQLMGRLPQRKPDSKWEYTSAATEGKEAEIQTMEEYIRRCQNMVTQYIAT